MRDGLDDPKHPQPPGKAACAEPAATAPEPAAAASEPPRLTVVTVAWNGLDLIRAHLESLAHCRAALDYEIEVVIVDNASRDGTPAMIERDFPWVVLIRNAANRGFAEGCAQGLARARGRYLLLLNPDCEANPGALTAMIEFVRRFPRVGAVGCRLLHGDGTPQRSAYRDQTPWRYVLYHSAASPVIHALKRFFRKTLATLGIPVEEMEASRPPLSCDWLMGACILVPRRVYEKVGPLDASFFMYSEDADWCRRIRQAGFLVYHLPGPALLHRQKQSSARSREFTYVRLYRSLLMLCLRQMAERDRVRMRRVVLADMALRRWILPALARWHPAQAPAHRERLRATRRVAEIWRRLDPEYDPDTPPEAPRSG